MADPLSYQVISATKTSLQQILIASGYQTDAGADVKLETPQETAADDIFLLVRASQFDRPTDVAIAKTARVMTIQIDAFVPAAFDTAELVLHQILEDIDTAMASAQSLFPATCSFPQFVRAARVPPADGMKWIGAHVLYSTTVRRAR